MIHVDHAAEARQHIEWTHDWQEREGDTSETGMATALIAQAHATLAVAEHLRIGNLLSIAHGDTEGSTSRSARDMAYMRLHNGDLPELLAPDVAAALGIGGGS